MTDKGALFGMVILLGMLCLLVFASLIAPDNPTAENPTLIAASPSLHHLLGTDSLGRDELSRLIYGARSTFFGGALAVAINIVVGVPLGLLAGYTGGVVDSAISRAADVVLGFPSFLLAVIVVAVLGPTLVNAAVSVGVAGIPLFIRLVRGTVLPIRESEYVLAAVGCGARSVRVLSKYVLPNVALPTIAFATLSFGTSVLYVAGLSFLGLGAQPPTADWGTMVQDGVDYLNNAPLMVIAPGVAIVLLVLAVNLVGDAIQDHLNVKGARWRPVRLRSKSIVEGGIEGGTGSWD